MTRNKSTVRPEESVKAHLKKIVKSDAKVYYIIWKYAPELLPQTCKTFNDLKSAYKVFPQESTDKAAENWLLEEDVQTAVKWLLKRENQKKMIELYNIYFRKAQDSTDAFKAFVDFSHKFFADDKRNDLLSMVENMSENDLKDD